MNSSISNRLPLENIFLVLVGMAVLARLHLVFVYEINWDEFLNLSMVYDHARGDLHEVLQTIFVHGFWWLDAVSDNEVDQIVAGRIVIFLLGLATALFIYLISRQFMPASAALIAVLGYFSFSFVLRQGNTFRTDQIATAMMMAALWLVVCKPARLRYAVLAGGLAGLAGLVTIKSVFYVPMLAIVLLANLLKAEHRGRAFRQLLAVGGAALVSFVAFYSLHWVTLDAPASTLAFLDRTTGKTLGERDFRQSMNFFFVGLVQNPVFWLVCGVGFLTSVRELLRPGSSERIHRTTALAFSVPLGSLLVYSEGFPYFYPFILAPVAVVCGLGVANAPGRLLPHLIATALAVTTFAHYLDALDSDNARQRLTLDVVHRAFPQPTPYIDRCSMVSAYPKRGLFMSVWGMADYYRSGVPIMRSVLEADQPRFLIANRRMLELDDLGPDEYGPEHFGLFKEDVDVLKANYIHHWGAIYVAGKRFAARDAGDPLMFDIMIEGPYTLEAAEPVMLDGRALQPGAVVWLDEGKHSLQLSPTSVEARLRWGEDLFRPQDPAPEGPLFRGF